MRYLADAALRRWQNRTACADRHRRGRHDRLRHAAIHRTRRTPARPRRARHAEPALARLPARDGGPDGTRRTRRRQFLALARGDVPLPRDADPRRRRGDRGTALRRVPAARLHVGRRVPLPAQRAGRFALCRSGGTRASHRGRGAECRHRPDPAAGAVSPLAVRRRAADRGTAPLRALRRRLCRPVRDDGAQRRHRHRTAFAARGHAGGTRRSHQHRAAAGRSTSTSPNRRRRSPTVSPGAVRARSPGCWTMRRSISAGAWCMRRTWMPRNASASRPAARWRGCARRPRRISATASFPCANTWPRAAVSASAAIPMSAPARSRNCAGSNTSAGWRRAHAT